MNRLAISYAFNASYIDRDGRELIDVYALAFMLFIAYRIKSTSRYSTEPTTLEEFEGGTKIGNRKLRDVRDMLATIGLVREGGDDAPDHQDPENRRPWSKRAVYELPGLCGPLFIVTPWDVDMNAAQLAAARAQKSAHGAERSARGAAFSPRNAAHGAARTRRTVPSSGPKAGGVLFSDLVPRGTNHDDDPDTAGIITQAIPIAAQDLLVRLRAEYPLHNEGALLTISDADALPILINLLSTGRPPDKLVEMAIGLWTCTDRDRGCRWIANETDRSLSILWKARDTLDQLVSRPRRRSHGTAPEHITYDPATTRQDAIRRAIAQLSAGHPVPAVSEAMARAAEALQAANPDIQAINRTLLEAARTACEDLAVVERSAREQLAPFRDRIPPDAYERAFQAAMEREIRDHLRIPSLQRLLELMPAQNGALA